MNNNEEISGLFANERIFEMNVSVMESGKNQDSCFFFYPKFLIDISQFVRSGRVQSSLSSMIIFE
jgi:hypothetical protein